MNMNYDELCGANISAFLTASEYAPKLSSYRLFSEALREKGLTFALSCSGAMFFSGIVDDFHDFDLLILPEEAEQVNKVFETIGRNVSSPSAKYFDDSYFATFEVAGTSVDVISDFTLITFGTRYRYELQKRHIKTLILPEGIQIPIIPPEAQFLLYAMMCGWQPQRKFKRELLLNFLCQRGSEFPEILEEALSLPLPYWIKDDIKKIDF